MVFRRTHYHLISTLGGGMSTCTPLSHLGYLKQWSKELNLPIVSVEYSLAPEFKHPTALNEISKVYKWLLTNSHQIGLKNDKIIVGGDRYEIADSPSFLTNFKCRRLLLTYLNFVPHSRPNTNSRWPHFNLSLPLSRFLRFC